MRTRNGFVSNSSSSSFIIGVGIVVDEEKVEELSKQFYGFKVQTVGELIIEAAENQSWSAPNFNKEHGILAVDSFTGDEVELNDIYSLPLEAKIVTVDFGEEDDSQFWNEDGGYYDYDWDPGEREQPIVDAFGDEEIIDRGHISWGAGRNG